MIAKPIFYPSENAILMVVPQPVPKSPKDYGMNYREIDFITCDDLVLRGWLINEVASKVVIMTHFGCRANRFGYQPQPLLSGPYKKEIEFYSVAKHLVSSGYGVLMYDLRGRGESDQSELGSSTGCIDERFDLIAAVDYIANEPSVAGKPIGLLSYSYGANISFSAMQEYSDGFTQSGVKAMVAVQPLSSSDFFKAINLPESIYQPVGEHYQVGSGGHKIIAPIEKAAKSMCIPTRLVQVSKDPFANLNRVSEIFKSIPVEKEMFWLTKPNHRFDGYRWFSEHPQDMLDWFDRYC